MRLLAPGAALLFTEGEGGGRLIEAASTTHYDAIPSDATIDPTGAGDVFLATMLAGLLQPELGEPLGLAAAAASLEPCHEDAASGAHEDRRDLARCRTHCNPPSAMADTAPPLLVPPCAVRAVPVLADAAAPRIPAGYDTPSPRAASPPIPIAYCTLLI